MKRRAVAGSLAAVATGALLFALAPAALAQDGGPLDPVLAPVLPQQEGGEVEPAQSESPECDPNYVPCVPPHPPDVNCPDIGHEVQVVGSDPHGLDGDNDGTGCDGFGAAAAPPPPTPVRAPARFTG
jgi:hypothetical protein